VWSISPESAVWQVFVDRVVRTRKPGDWRKCFAPEGEESFRPILDPVLAGLGYDRDWQLKENPVVRLKHASG